MHYKTIAVLSISTLCFLPHLWAAPPDRGWTLNSNLSMHWGEAREIVHYVPAPTYPAKSEYLSLLEWELNNTLMFGADINWESGNVLGLDFDFDIAIPGWHSGEMNDYDWLFSDKDWSHWSVSDTNIRWGLIADVATDFRTLEIGSFSLYAGLALHIDWWAWTEKLKGIVYSSGISPDKYPILFDAAVHKFRTVRDSEYIGTETIHYWVTYNALLAVLKARLQEERLFLELEIRIGPTLLISQDFHIVRDLVISNVGFSFPWVDGSIDIGIHLSETLSLVFRGEIAWMGDSVADTSYYKSGSFDSIVPNAGGAGFLRGGINILFSWQQPAIYQHKNI